MHIHIVFLTCDNIKLWVVELTIRKQGGHISGLEISILQGLASVPDICILFTFILINIADSGSLNNCL